MTWQKYLKMHNFIECCVIISRTPCNDGAVMLCVVWSADDRTMSHSSDTLPGRLRRAAATLLTAHVTVHLCARVKRWDWGEEVRETRHLIVSVERQRLALLAFLRLAGIPVEKSYNDKTIIKTAHQYWEFMFLIIPFFLTFFKQPQSCKIFSGSFWSTSKAAQAT